MNPIAVVAIAIFTISLFFTSIEANAQLSPMISEFCSAVARGMATGPQSGMCSSLQSGIQPGSTASGVGNTAGCLPQFAQELGCTPNSSTGSTGSLSCPSGIQSLCTTATNNGCPSGTTLSGNTCVATGSNPLPTQCPAGTTLQGSNTCVLTSCPAANEIIQNNVCVPTQTIPTANAGQDQTVSAGTQVVLDGSASVATTSGATITGYTWQQTSGPSVTLNSPNTATTFFTAPSNGTTLTFSLTVTDSNGQVSKPSSVTVNVAAS